MKYFPLFAPAILLTACAFTPEDQADAHQRQLEKEARENFIAMKAQEHPGQPVVLHDEAPPATPKPKFLSFLDEQHPANGPAKARPTPAPEPYSAAQPASHSRAPRDNDDTVYYWQVPSARQQTTPRQQAAEVKYARELAKRPEDLSPEERLYAHEHF